MVFFNCQSLWLMPVLSSFELSIILIDFPSLIVIRKLLNTVCFIGREFILFAQLKIGIFDTRRSIYF